MKKIRMLPLFAVAILAMAATSVPLPTLPQSGKAIQDFVPKGWHVLSVTEGDIDADSDADTVLALASDAENNLKQGDSTQYPRLLVFLLKNKKGYTLAASSDKALLCKTCNGTTTDPFQKATIENGDVVIRHEVKGKKHISTTHRFRYQDGEWYLIGKKTDTYRPNGEVATSVEKSYAGNGQKMQAMGTGDKKISDYINFQPKAQSNVSSFNIGQEYWDVNNWGSGS